LLWCPREHECDSKLATVDGAHLRRWDASGTATSSKPVSVFPSPLATAAAWCPHAAEELCVATETDALFFDCRDGGKVSLRVPQPHDGATLDVDYNPNKLSALATAGDDGTVRFWDLRRNDQPLAKVLRTSAAWCTAVKYNRFHDQLLASATADNLVQLWRVSSISSAPLLDSFPGDDDDGDLRPKTSENSNPDDDDDDLRPGASDNNPDAKAEPTAADVQVRTFDLHDDAVYGLAWSAADAWIFASLSFDGRLVLNHVPSPEKYKILL